MAVITKPATIATPMHSRVESGDTYVHDSIHLSIANNSILYHLLRTGSRSVHLKLYHASVTGAPMSMEVSEAPVITSVGTLAAVINKNRVIQKPNTAQVYENTVVTTTGIRLEGDLISGTKQTGGSQVGIDDEWVFSPNTDYLFMITNSSGGVADISFHIEWYEEDVHF